MKLYKLEFKVKPPFLNEMITLFDEIIEDMGLLGEDEEPNDNTKRKMSKCNALSSAIITPTMPYVILDLVQQKK